MAMKNGCSTVTSGEFGLILYRMFNRAITVEIVYCSENEAISRVMLMLYWPNVPVGILQEVYKSMKPRATFAAKDTNCGLYNAEGMPYSSSLT